MSNQGIFTRPLFTRKSAAQFAAVSVGTIDNAIKRGKLRAFRIGAAVRIKPEDMDAFLARCHEEAQ